MSTPSLLRCLLALLVLSGSVGCWEQWSETWFPQMKWQKAIQAFERVEWVGPDGRAEGPLQGFSPPEGTIPVTGRVASFDRYDAAADALVNPTSASDFRSIRRGQEVYQANCEACHGAGGMGDGPVSATRIPGTNYDAYPEPVRAGGPFAGVFPLATATARSDGYVYNFIRNGGGRMPNYRRIPNEDLWHLVNYVRYLQRGGQP